MGSRNSQPAGRPHADDVEQQLASQAQALVDGVAAVEMRIVDQPLPADGRARLFEIHAHDDPHVVHNPLRKRGQACGVLQRGATVVDRARADDHEEAIVLGIQDAHQGVASAADHVRTRRIERKIVSEQGW